MFDLQRFFAMCIRRQHFPKHAKFYRFKSFRSIFSKENSVHKFVNYNSNNKCNQGKKHSEQSVMHQINITEVFGRFTDMMNHSSEKNAVKKIIYPMWAYQFRFHNQTNYEIQCNPCVSMVDNAITMEQWA